MALPPSPPPEPLEPLEPPGSPISSTDATGDRLRRDAPVADDDDLDAQLQLAELRRRFAGAEVEPVRFRHWEIERRLGRGGMGAVYLARDPELDRRVALKILAPPPGSDRSLMNQRLRREAQALARIQHANVVQVHGVDLEAGRTVIEMEYVDGPTLRQWQQERRPWREVVATYARVGDGLVAIHEAGLVHRDVKPDNLLMGPDGVPKVVDLGLAVGSRTPTVGAATSPARPSLLGLPLTHGSSVVGTPGYMAPEQFGTGETSAACDQFSFAASLYEALMGVLPFQGANPADYAEALRRGVLHVPEHPPSLPRWLHRALRRALRFDPADRHRSTKVLVDALRRGLARRRRWLLGSGGLVGLVIVPSAVWILREPLPDPCAPLAVELAATTREDDAARELLRTRAAALGSPHVDNARRVFDEAVERHAAQWADGRLGLCDAQARQAAADEPRDDVMDRERACLEHIRARLDDALVAVAAASDDDLAARLVYAMTAVERLPACDDPRTLAHWPDAAPPALDHAIAEALRLELAGDHVAAEAQAREAVAASEGAHPFFHAEALYRLGHVLGQQERSKEAFSTIERARNAALEVGNHGLLCEAVAFQAKLVAAVELDPEASARELGLAWACMELAGVDSPFVRAELIEAQGRLAEAANDPDEAVRRHEEALALRIEHFGPEHHEVGRSLHNLGNARADRGELEAGRQALRGALALHERFLGPWHPKVANVRFDLANLQVDMGEHDEAKAGLERVLAIQQRVYGADAPRLAIIHLALASAEVLRPSPDLAFARAQLERARALQQVDPDLDEHHPDRADVLQLEGSIILSTSPVDWAAALDVFSQATAIVRRHDPRSSAVQEGTVKELEVLYGLEDHAQLAARVAVEGPPLRRHIEQLEPSERGKQAWWIAESSMQAGRPAQAVSYGQLAITTYRALGDQAAVDELTALARRAEQSLAATESPKPLTPLTPRGAPP